MGRLIVAASLRFRLLVVLGAVAVMALGFFRLPKAPADVLPEFAPPYVEVQTEALGLSATEVEQLITAPMEADLLSQVAFLDKIQSESVPGLSSIQLYFERGTDELEARQLVQERLTEATALPRVSKAPVMMQPLSSTNRVMVVGLSAQDLSLIEMSVLARWNIRPKLMGVPGVANVAIFGQREQQLQVRVDPDRLAERGVVLDQVVRTAANALWVSPLSFVEASTPGTGGFIETPNQRIGIQHVLPITAPRHLEQVVVEGTGGRTLRLGDVTTVRQDHQPLIGDALVADEPSLMLVVEKFPGTDTVDVTADVEAALDELRPGLPGMTIDTTIFRPASFIESAVGNMAIAALVALLLVTAWVAVVQRSWRAGLVCLIALPLSMVGAGLVLYAAGATINALVIAGLLLALVVVIDDAVQDSHALVTTKSPHRPIGRTDQAVVDAVLATRGSLVYGTLILSVASVPVLLVGGLTSEFLRPMVWAYLAAVAVSLVIALTITPVLSRALLPKSPASSGDAQHVPPGRTVSALGRLASSWQSAYAVTAALVIVGAVAWPFLGNRTALPAFTDRALMVAWEGPPGTSLPEMNRITSAVTSELRNVPGVHNVGAHVGRAITGDQVTNVNSGEIWLSLEAEADYDPTVQAVEQVLAGYPGIDQELLTYPEDRVREVEDDEASPFVVRVYGDEWDVLHNKATEIQALLADSDQVANPRVDRPVLQPTVEVEVELAAAERVGVKPGDVRRAAATMLSGIEVGNLFEQQKVFEVIVVGATDTRQSLVDVENLMINTPTGRQVRLDDVADVRVEPSPELIEHDSVSRRIDVEADLSGGSTGAVVDDIEQSLEQVEFPLGYHAEVLTLGPSDETDGRFLMYVGAALLSILLLLQAAFGSWRLAAIFLLLLAASTVGVLLTTAALGGELATTTLLAYLAVIGIAARTDVALVREFQRRERQEAHADRAGLVAKATSERVGPIVTSASAIVLSMLPFSVLGSATGLEVVHPLALAIAGGVLTSAIVSLVVLPAIYLRHAPPPGQSLLDPDEFATLPSRPIANSGGTA